MENFERKLRGPVAEDPLRVVVVDDDPQALDPVERTLEREGYVAITTRFGEKALDRLKEERIDVVVSELRLPDVGGIEFLRRVKRESPSTRVIVSTAYPSVSSAVEAMRKGADDYIGKPVEPRDLGTTVAGAVKNLEFDEFRRDVIKTGRDSFEMFERMVREGRMGLCVCRVKPSRLEESRCLKENVEFIRLSDDEGSSGIHPGDLKALKGRIDGASSRSDGVVILIDCVDYLLEYSSPDAFRKFVNGLGNDLVSGRLALIMSGDSEKVEKEHLSELRDAISDVLAGAVFESLSSYTRRRALSILREREASSFSALLAETGAGGSSKLSFHLGKLRSAGLIEKGEGGRYRLTEIGKNAAGSLEKMRGLGRGGGFGRVVWIPWRT